MRGFSKAALEKTRRTSLVLSMSLGAAGFVADLGLLLLVP